MSTMHPVRWLLRQHLPDRLAMVAMGNLAVGVYFVNVVADGGIKTVKIVR